MEEELPFMSQFIESKKPKSKEYEELAGRAPQAFQKLLDHCHNYKDIRSLLKTYGVKYVSIPKHGKAIIKMEMANKTYYISDFTNPMLKISFL